MFFRQARGVFFFLDGSQDSLGRAFFANLHPGCFSRMKGLDRGTFLGRNVFSGDFLPPKNNIGRKEQQGPPLKYYTVYIYICI